jgi:nicotinamide-nucleotide amidase
MKNVSVLLEVCRKNKITLATAESCTGGLIAALFTSIAGSSDVFECGFVTYSNASKQDLLGVKASMIKRHGAVSEAVAQAMAGGVLANSKAHISVAVTGVAGPGGGSKDKPVGLVYIAVSPRTGSTVVKKHRFVGDRHAIRMAAVEASLQSIRLIIA